MFHMNEYIYADKRYYIYGTKGMGFYCFNNITDRFGEESVMGFIETKPMADECCGKKIFTLDEIECLDDDTYIILASPNYYKDMMDNLIANNISVERIIVLDKLYPLFKNIVFFGGKHIKKVCFWPPINRDDKDIQKKISWFLPDRLEVTVWGGENIKDCFNNNIHVEYTTNAERKLNEADVIYLWCITNNEDILSKYMDKVYIVDPNFWYYTETINFFRIYDVALGTSEKNILLGKSEALFNELKINNKAKRTNVFCSGPSIEEVYNGDFRDDLNIVTNSMVKNTDFLKQVNPKILIFTDPNFYFSPNEYCEKFYKDVLDAVDKYDMYIIIFDHSVSLILHHFPELKGRVIGVPSNSDSFTFPSLDNFSTKSTGNILTELLLPIASALCDEIAIAGCTGRNPDEAYYWQHNPKTQYLDLMKSVFDMYPSVFRDQKYANYYEKHCQIVEQIIEYGEQLGKKYINLTTSYIPALIRRTKKIG